MRMSLKKNWQIWNVWKNEVIIIMQLHWDPNDNVVLFSKINSKKITILSCTTRLDHFFFKLMEGYILTLFFNILISNFIISIIYKKDYIQVFSQFFLTIIWNKIKIGVQRGL